MRFFDLFKRKKYNFEKTIEYERKQYELIKPYISEIENPSEAFQTFIEHYFTGHPMILSRREEDYTVWEKMKKEELKIASQMILDNLGHNSGYIRAVGMFRDERAIPMLENLVDTLLDENSCYERLLAAKVLFDWTGYAKYLDVLAEVLPNGETYLTFELLYWITGIDKKLANHYIFMMIENKSSFERWRAYETLLLCNRAIAGQFNESANYYIDYTVYNNKPLFRERLNELKRKFDLIE